MGNPHPPPPSAEAVNKVDLVMELSKFLFKHILITREWFIQFHMMTYINIVNICRYMLFFFATLNSSCPSPIFQYIYSRRPTKCSFSVSNLSSWEYLFRWFIIIQKGFSTFPLFMTLICDCWLNGLDITLHCLASPPPPSPTPSCSRT